MRGTELVDHLLSSQPEMGDRLTETRELPMGFEDSNQSSCPSVGGRVYNAGRAVGVVGAGGTQPGSARELPLLVSRGKSEANLSLFCTLLALSLATPGGLAWCSRPQMTTQSSSPIWNTSHDRTVSFNSPSPSG